MKILFYLQLKTIYQCSPFKILLPHNSLPQLPAMLPLFEYVIAFRLLPSPIWFSDGSGNCQSSNQEMFAISLS